MMTAQVIDPERLKQARKLRGLTQGELAQRARKNQTPLNKRKRRAHPTLRLVTTG